MEDPIYQDRTSLIHHASVIVVGVVLILMSILLAPTGENRGGAIAFFLLGLFLIGYANLNVYATSYTVTSERVIQRDGVISRRISEIEISDIRNVQVTQDILQRIVGIGNVGVSTAGQSDVEVTFTGIRRPQDVAELIRQQRKKAQA